MLLRPRRSFLVDSRLTLTAASFPAQSIRIPIPRVAPYAIEDIYVTVQVTMAAAVTSAVVGYGLLNILKRLQLGNIPNAAGSPTNKIDASGQFLLQHLANEGLRLDGSTERTLYAQNKPNYINAGVYRVVYRVPMVHPFLTDGFRPRCLLPIWTYNQDPILSLDFSSAAEMSGTADPFSAAAVSVQIVAREMTSGQIAAINAQGGFFDWDLLESIYNPAGSLTNIQTKFAIATPGSYMGLLMYMLKGGTTQVPFDMSGTTTFGSETEWQLKGAGKDILESWRMRELQSNNEQSRSFQAVAAADSAGAAYAQATATNGVVSVGNFGGALSAGLAVQAPSSVFLDFASDGVTDIRELGSLLPTKQYSDRGLPVEIIGNITTAAASTFANVVGIGGRRILSDVSAFAQLAGL